MAEGHGLHLRRKDYVGVRRHITCQHTRGGLDDFGVTQHIENGDLDAGSHLENRQFAFAFSDGYLKVSPIVTHCFGSPGAGTALPEREVERLMKS